MYTLEKAKRVLESQRTKHDLLNHLTRPYSQTESDELDRIIQETPCVDLNQPVDCMILVREVPAATVIWLKIIEFMLLRVYDKPITVLVITKQPNVNIFRNNMRRLVSALSYNQEKVFFAEHFVEFGLTKIEYMSSNLRSTNDCTRGRSPNVLIGENLDRLHHRTSYANTNIFDVREISNKTKLWTPDTQKSFIEQHGGFYV